MKLAAAALVALGCRAAAPPHPVVLSRTPIAQDAAAAGVVAVVERDDALYVFAPDRVAIDRGGAVAVTVPAPTGGWAEAVAIPALDDAGTWVVARTTAGELWRVTASGELEPIDDRLGLPPGIRAIAATVPAEVAAAPPATVALALDDGVAILRDRRHLARFGLGAPGAVTAGRDRIALRRGADIEVWRLPDQRRVDYRVPGALSAVFVDGAPAGRDALMVATPRALYVEAGDGLRRVAAPAEIRSVAPAGSRLWIATASGVYLFERGAFLPTALTAAADHLFGLAGGDAVLAAQGRLVRLSQVRQDVDPRWLTAVQPVVQRVCARCHRPGGSARVDLSTLAAWRAERAELIRRVVETRTMPPAGTELGDRDRQALASWLIDQRR
jgi:hypothetical protein